MVKFEFYMSQHIILLLMIFFFSNVGKFKKYSWRLGCTKMEGSPDLAHGLSSLISKYTFLEFKNPNPYFQQKSKYEHKLIHTYNF